MEEGLLSLKWNHHKATFFQILSVLREKHTYTDVTLACDGRLYPVHKFILSTCSEYFSDIFTSNTGNNIVIVLKDVRRQDLEYLLDYMYLGQVDVAQSELSSLIKTAECLRIKGLAIPDDEPHTAARRVIEEKERDPSPPSKKKRLHGEDNRVGSVSSNNVSSRIPPMLSIHPPSLPLSTPQQHALRIQPLSQQSQSSPTSQPNSKSHTLSLPPHSGSRTSQIPSSPISTSSSHALQAHPHSSPTQSNPLPVIKQEVADPLESDYGQENYEDTKPDISDSHHLEQDMAVAGPSGIQGSTENWDGEGDLASFGSGEAYPESGMEESADSEAQGEPLQGADGCSRPFGRHKEPVYGCIDTQSGMAKEADSALIGQHLTTPRRDTYKHQSKIEGSNKFEGKKISESSILRSSDMNKTTASEPFAEIIYDSSNVAGDNSSGSQDFPVAVENPLSSVIRSSSTHSQPSDENLLRSEYSLTKQQQWKHLLGYETNSSKYICQWCGRTFDRISNLKRHVLLHSGIKPFKCLYCNYRATQKANVVQHVASRHRDEMRALLNNNINVNDMLVPTSGTKG